MRKFFYPGNVTAVTHKAMNRKLKGKIIEVFGTQADFSQTLGVNESVVSRVVRGRKTLTPAEAERWARALGMTAEALDEIQHKRF